LKLFTHKKDTLATPPEQTAPSICRKSGSFAMENHAQVLAEPILITWWTFTVILTNHVQSCVLFFPKQFLSSHVATSVYHIL
jgi:hypothetical protein